MLQKFIEISKRYPASKGAFAGLSEDPRWKLKTIRRKENIQQTELF